MKKIKDYGLRFYVKNTYSQLAGKRGGAVLIQNKFTCYSVEDILNKVAIKYPITLN